jgi:hypothetical protein
LVLVALLAIAAVNFESIVVWYFDVASSSTPSASHPPVPRDQFRYLNEEIQDDRLRILLKCYLQAMFDEFEQNDRQVGGLTRIGLMFPFGYTSRTLTLAERRELQQRESRTLAQTLRDIAGPATLVETAVPYQAEREEFLRQVDLIFARAPLSELSYEQFERFADLHFHHWRHKSHDSSGVEFRVSALARLAYDHVQRCLHDEHIRCS